MATPKLLTPIADITAFIQRRKDIAEFVQNVLVPGSDYGSASGSDEQKPTLLKPGAEKFVHFFGLEPHLTLLEQRIDIDRPEPFIFFSYHCAMVRDGVMYGEADGCASSHEIKYRYRWVPAEHVPQHLDIASLPKRDQSITEFDFAIQRAETTGPYGKPAEYWERWKEAIKSGKAIRVQKMSRTGKPMDAWVMPHILYRIPNPDVADQINTIMKMAQKRAFVAATLIACGISELFTQDLEDWAAAEIPAPSTQTQDKTEQPAADQATPPPPPPPPAATDEYTIPLKQSNTPAPEPKMPAAAATTEPVERHIPVESLSAAKKRILAIIEDEASANRAINEYLRSACNITTKAMPKMHPLYHDAIWRLALTLQEREDLRAAFLNSPAKLSQEPVLITGNHYSIETWVAILSERWNLPAQRILDMTEKLAGMTNQEMLHWFILAYHDIVAAQLLLDRNINPSAAYAAACATLRQNIALTNVRSSDVAGALDRFLETQKE